MNDLPWLSYLAIEYLDQLLTVDSAVFEWGCGGSTIFLSERSKSVISIEHNKKWFDEIRMIVGKNVIMKLIEPEPREEVKESCSNPDDYKSFSITGSFRNYASVIDNYTEFDLVLVDGRARASCIKHAIPHIKTGGWLIVDNTERPYYLENQNKNYVDKFEYVKIFGKGPRITWPWETTFLRRVRQ